MRSTGSSSENFPLRVLQKSTNWGMRINRKQYAATRLSDIFSSAMGNVLVYGAKLAVSAA